MTYRDWDDPMTVLAEAVTARGFGRATIGTDHYAFDMPVRVSPAEALPSARFADIGRTVWELRPIKSPAGIALLRRAAGIADAAIVATAAV